VREEDLDWDIYHIIAMKGDISLDELVEQCGHPGVMIRNSVARLERKNLISQNENVVRVLSLQESMARCQLQQSMDDCIYMEDGIIKVRSGSERDSR
jgi:DeoR/GlpR family transcriptional regulator of sugar metabolism